MLLASVLPKGSFKYMLMPELVARINALVLGGFQYIPFFIAIVYNIVRLLPSSHPYVNPVNIGRFGIRHVVAEAANHLVFDRRNIDKVLIFFLVLCGLSILFLQIALVLLAFVFPTVMAFPTNWNGFFVVNPLVERRQDLAFIMLDMVFGVPSPDAATPSFFESCVAAGGCETNFGVGIIDPNVGGTPVTVLEASRMSPLATGASGMFPFPIHMGLHRLFGVYSTGLLVIAVIIASYFIATILAETAQSGTPFGRRFNKMWAPIRLVVAFGLLIPMGTGLNSSQYLVLYAAKFGSAFATNGWKFFNNSLTTNYLGGALDLVAVPTLPEVGRISEALFLARVCNFSYLYSQGTNSPDIRMWHILAQSKTPPAVQVTAAYTFDNAQDAVDEMVNSLTVRFGEYDEVRYPNERGYVRPYCGEMQFHLSDPRRQSGALTPEPGPYQIQRYFWDLVRDMWYHAGGSNAFLGGAVVGGGDRANTVAWIRFNQVGPPTSAYPDAPYVHQVNSNVYNSFRTAVNAAVTAQIASPRWSGSWSAADPVYRKGWAAGGIWYNRIAEMNHPITVSVHALPTMSLEPLLLDQLKEKKAQYNTGNNLMDIFSPQASGVEDVSTLIEGADGQDILVVLYEAHKIWSSASGTTDQRSSGNQFIDAISYILGTNGLYDLRRNPNTHPLAQLVSLGRSLVQRSVEGISFGFFTAVGGIGASLVGEADLGNLLSVISSLVFTISMIGITAGFILAYVLPFLPFIYFFFAVGGWIKGIFEAMVGAPLWALAHIRIDAQGLPGNAALNGYYLIFEVFLRPILIVFGLLAAISIYTALVASLNSTFDLVIHNMGGFDVSAEVTAVGPSFIDFMRGPIDEFFYTIIYAVIVYMMGMSSFKLIDTIPNNILRWMGQSVATFGDMREDPAAGLVGRASLGAQQVTGKIGGGLGGFAQLGAKQNG